MEDGRFIVARNASVIAIKKPRIVAALREYDAHYGITEDDLK
jgi:hypothetical protein